MRDERGAVRSRLLALWLYATLDGVGSARAMQMALERRDVSAEWIDVINPHGTSTPQGDKLETLAIKRTFGDHAHSIAEVDRREHRGHLDGVDGALSEAHLDADSIFAGVQRFAQERPTRLSRQRTLLNALG